MKKITTDRDLLRVLTELAYGVNIDAEETNYYNGQYYYWKDFKDYKGLLDR